jgi:nitroimidazol reductase NimA-like FMN-containing flavoprotein (pyridoxamine 5'-phosphate oxidase superfamily)
MENQDSLKTDRSRVRRLAKRGLYDRETIDSILDAHFLCQVAVVHQGAPHIIPTLYARDGDRIYLHGSSKSLLLNAIRDGAQFCFSVTLMDAVVVARSAFNHSANYRSVILYGQGTELTDPDERLHAMEVLTNRILPGRWNESRQPSPKELKATLMVSLPITEGAAKVRSGPPIDEDEDYATDYWAGLIPLQTQVLPPVSDPLLKAGIGIPDSVKNFRMG